MANQRKSYERLTTPKGKAMYPFLHKTDTKFDDPGIYRISLIVSGEEGADFATQLSSLHDKYYDEYCEKEGSGLKRGNDPYRIVKDEDGMDTEDYEFKFKLKSVVKGKGKTWEQRPVVYDSQMNVIDVETLTEMNMGNGSECRVSFEIFPYYTGMAGMGLSLRLKSVQIIDLVEYVQDKPDFDTEENGFVAKTTETADFA